MVKLKVFTLLLGAVLFLGFGASTLNAQMKCGAGKCGASMEMPKTCANKKACGTNKKSCGNKDCTCKDCNCGKDCKCGEKKAVMKCGAGKCGTK